MTRPKSKIVLVNSYGPMGSTVLASIIEKFGFGNTPVRKLGLNEYLMGKIDPNSDFMKERIISIMSDHQNPISIGGISVLDRDNNEEIRLIDPVKFHAKKSSFKRKQSTSLSDLFISCRRFYDECVVYKNVTNDAYMQIELTTNNQHYNAKELYKAYRKNFDEVYIISLTRNFESWINALASQAMSHPNFKNRYLFAPHEQHKIWKNYNNHIEAADGLIVSFEQLFDDPLEKLVPILSDYLSMPKPNIDFKNSDYDLYGRLKNYKETFTPFDDKRQYLSKRTLAEYDARLHKKSKFTSWDAFRIRLLYLTDMSRFRKNYI